MPDSSNPQTVVAVFADRATAQRAVDALVTGGEDTASVHLHEDGMVPRNGAGVMLDEYATGGFFTNFAHLLDGLLGTPPRSPSYEDLVRFEGAAVSVEVASADQAEAVEARLRDAGARQVGSGRGLEPS